MQKSNCVISGFSAGAVVLSPTIAISRVKGRDKNNVGINDLTGLGIIDFEVFAHYSKEWEKAVANYKKTTRNRVKKITDDDYIVINS
jgi:peptidase E